MPSPADTWESQPLTTLLTPGASDAREQGQLCQRTAARGGPHGPLSLRPPPSWPLGDPAAGLGCGYLSDAGCPHEGGHCSHGDPRSPGLPTWPLLSHSPSRDCLLPLGPKPSRSIRSGHLQGRAETHPAPTVSAAKETRRCCGEQSLPQAEGHPPRANRPWAGPPTGLKVPSRQGLSCLHCR